MPETIAKSSTSFKVSRILAAPQDAVFEAWTEPSMLKQWWGPPGYTAPSAEVDLRPGGKYRLAMKPPDEDVYYLTGTFVEVRRPDKLVYTWAWDEDNGPGHESLVTVEFLPRGEKTEVIVTQERLANEESRDKHIEGWNGCLDELSKLLETRSIRLSVTIAAPATSVFRALTDDRELERWWPTTAKSDVRPGGAYFYSFQFEDASQNLDQDGVFTEVSPNSRLGYTWPATEQDVRTDVMWELDGSGNSTTVSVVHSGFGYGDVWDASFQGHTDGWNAFIENLKSVLEGGPDNRKSAMAMKTRT